MGPLESIKQLLPGKLCKTSECRGQGKGQSEIRHTLYHSDFPKQLLNLALGKNCHTPLFKNPPTLQTGTLEREVRVLPPFAVVWDSNFSSSSLFHTILSESLRNAQNSSGRLLNKTTGQQQ